MTGTEDLGGGQAPRTPPSYRRRSRDQDSISIQDDRGHWGSRVEFILACLGYSVGLGNMWRFPYLAYENGGAAFLLPYLILLFVIGRPLYLMEVALGQYGQLGAVHTWLRVTPFMGGLGYSQVLKSIVKAPSYMLVIGYSLHYLYNSLAYIGHKLPWETCSESWEETNCYVVGEEVQCTGSIINTSVPCTRANQTSAQQYWSNEVLGLDSHGMEVFGDMGGMQVGLVLSLLAGWIITGISLMYGIKSSGKVVYFTATFPFLILLILMIAGLQLEGASMGLHYLFVPKWEKLLEVNVWRQAAEQVLYSLSVGGSGLITFGSYNDFNNKVHVDVMILAVLDLMASLLCAVTVFSVLGAMAYELDLPDISTVVTSGPGLAFVAYPQAITRTLPIPHLWAALFFFMIFTLGLDSIFGGLETLITYVFDEFPRTRNHKPWMVSAICVVLFILGLPYCTQKGQYLFFLLDVFLTGVGSLLFGFLSCVALNWVYGVRKFSDDYEFMLRYRPSKMLQAIWAVVAPISLFVLFVGSLARWKWPLYGGKIGYPQWALAIGGVLPVLVAAPLFVIMALQIIKRVKTRDWGSLLAPDVSWGPGDPVAKQRLYEERRLAEELRLREHYSSTGRQRVETSKLTQFWGRIWGQEKCAHTKSNGFDNPGLDVTSF